MQCFLFCFVFLQDKIQYNCTFTYKKKKKRGTKQLFFCFPEKSSRLIRKRNTRSTTEGMWWSTYPPSLHKVTRYFLRDKKCYQEPATVGSQNSQSKLTFIQANSRLLLSTVLQQCLTSLIISYTEYGNIHMPKH